jgi:hypothetical protein
MEWKWSWLFGGEPVGWNLDESSLSTQSIVLDMDECLIHTFECSQKKYMEMITDPITLQYRKNFFDVPTDITASGKSPQSFGVFRPGLIEFLEYCFKRFQYVVLWSAGEDFYVKQVSQYFFSKTGRQPHLVCARSNCYLAENGAHTKPIHHLTKPLPGLFLHNAFFVDDNADNSFFNKDNHILISAFEPQCNSKSVIKALSSDHALYDLIEWFESDEVKLSTDIRKLDKTTIFKA